jgi:Na+/proline symporter
MAARWALPRRWAISARLSFSGLAQLAPAVILAVYWPGLPARAVLAGILSGVLVWAYVLFLPLLVSAGGITPSWVSEGPLGLSLFSPQQLIGLGSLDALSRAVLGSLLVNIAVIILVSRWLPDRDQRPVLGGQLERSVLIDLADRFLPADRVERLFADPGRHPGAGIGPGT